MKKGNGNWRSIAPVVIMGVLTMLLWLAFLYLAFGRNRLGTITVFHVSGELFSIVICQVVSYSLSKATGKEQMETIVETSRGFRIYRVLCLVFMLLMFADVLVWMCFGHLAEGTHFWMTMWYLLPMAALALAYAGIYRWMSQRSKKLQDSFRHLMSENVVSEISKEEKADTVRMEYVTVLFCQVKGLENDNGEEVFGNMTSDDEEDSPLHRFLRFFYTETAEVCEKHGGTALEFPGYCVLCVFGALGKLERHEAAAVDTALEILAEMEALKKLQKETDFPSFDIGIGISTGNIHVGNVGSETQKRFTVIGSGVNLASRLAGYAKPGEIIIAENVRKAVLVSMDTEVVDSVMPKGFDAPVSIYRVKRNRGGR